jgi:transposase-like protein
MRGKKHDDALRAAVIASLLVGQSVSEVAREYKLDTGTVSRWKKAIPRAKLQEIAAKKANNIDDLIENYLRQLFVTLTVQAKVAAEPTYARRQPASELAVLHGVMCDKGFRILEAVQRAADPTPGEGDEDTDDQTTPKG